MKNNTYYVYVYLRKDLYSPYYVGKGKEGSYRHLSKNHSVRIPKDRNRIRVIKDNLTEQESIDLEKLLILFYGRLDQNTGVLRNLTEGGEGTSGYKHKPETIEKLKGPKTEEHKIKLSEGRKGKKYPKLSESKKGCQTWNKGIPMSEESKKKLSESKKGSKPWNKGIPMSEESKKKLSDNKERSESISKTLSTTLFNKYSLWFFVQDPLGVSWCELSTLRLLCRTYNLNRNSLQKTNRSKGWVVKPV